MVLFDSVQRDSYIGEMGILYLIDLVFSKQKSVSDDVCASSSLIKSSCDFLPTIIEKYLSADECDMLASHIQQIIGHL